MPTRVLIAPIVAALLIVLPLTACGTSGGSGDQSGQAVTCDDVLASVLQRERTGDTAGVINSELDWLSRNCSSEYDVFVDYASAKGMAEQFGPDTCDSLTQYIEADAIALLSQEELCTGGPAGSSDVSPPDGAILWNQALAYAGTTQRVCGPLAGSGNSDDDVFLNLGLDYPDPGRFQIVLWDVGGVESLALGTTLCTTGPISVYEGVAQIELESASLVEVRG